VGFETMHTFCQPVVLESPMKLQSGSLHLHPRLQPVGRLRATSDKAVNLFLDVDERLFHDGFSIGRSARRIKQLKNENKLSLYNKNDLTNGIYGFILCAMNANGISSKASPHLNRIQNISRTLKICVLAYFVAPLGFMALSFKSLHVATGMVSIFNQPYASVSDIPVPMYVLYAIGMGIYLLGAISFYRLLNLYEKAVIFSEANVREIKRLGTYLACYGILAVTASAFYIGGITPFTLLDFACSPWIVGGGAINLVAGIMDEGRKIQEEQELTV
jgi:hypothetical protein